MIFTENILQHDTTVPYKTDLTTKSSDLGIIIGITLGTLLVMGFGILALVSILRIKGKVKVNDGNEAKHQKKRQQKDAKQHKKLEPSRRISITSIVNRKVYVPTIDEFNKLIQYDSGLGQRFTTAQGMRYNKIGQLNLVPTNLPFDHNRVKIRTPIQGCDYINANWITPLSDDNNTYDQLIYTSYLPFYRIQFAVGQEPLSHTENMHYQMIHENRFDFVLSFTNDPKDDYLEADEVRSFTKLNLHVLSRTRVNKNLCRSEISLFNTRNAGAEYKHNFIHFEFDAWPKEKHAADESIELLVSSMCLMRNEMSLNKSSLKIFATDTRGGVGASALFVAMYEIMQDVDEAFTDNDRQKQSVVGIDVFEIVNRLRKDREHMIEDFSTYGLLFKCLQYYGSNRKSLNQLKPMEAFDRDPLKNSDEEGTLKSGNHQTIYGNQKNSDVIDYVLHYPNVEDNNEGVYLERRQVEHHKYQNIEEMSEYL